MNFLNERLEEGYNLIVVRRKRPGLYYCSKEEEVEESGTIALYDEFNLPEDFVWPLTLNVIYKIEDILEV